MNPGELDTLVALVRSSRHERVIEFGCNSGRTAKVLLREIFDIKEYVGVDVTPGYRTPCVVQQREIPTNPGAFALEDHRFSLILRTRGTWDLNPADLRTADVVFIDGDHSYHAVLNDTKLAKSIIRPGGMIIWHDYHQMPVVEVRQVLDHLYTDYGAKIHHVENTWLAFQRF